MKKTAFWMAMALLFSVLFVRAAATDTVTVAKGDSLWKIAQKQTGITWQEIAKENKISGPKYLIYPSQKLVILGSVKSKAPKTEKAAVSKKRLWAKVGGNPYRGTPEWALSQTGWPKEIQDKIRLLIAVNTYAWETLSRGQTFDGVTFGRNRAWRDVIADWQEGTVYAAKDYGVDGYHFVNVLKCNNWVWWKEEPKPEPSFPAVPVAEEIKIDFPPVPVFESADEIPPVPVFGSQESRVCDNCGFDLYIGGGIYETDRWLNGNNKNYHARGWYVWGKVRERPFGFDVTDSISACLGAFAFGALGEGNNEDYDYSWKKWAIGPSLGLTGRHWDADLDVGLWGRLISGGEEGLYESKQVDNIFLFSSHLNLYGRRDRGEKWFPKTEFNLELTLPYDQEHKHSWDGNLLKPDPYNNQVLEISLTQHIYDLRVSDNLLLTPGFNLGYAHEYGRDDPSFIQIGPRMTMSLYNQDIVSISFLNYKENLGGDGDQWHWLSGYISVGGIIKAYRASQINEAADEDLSF